MFYNEKIDFIIERRDIDTNGHVNNKKYIEWMFETTPQETYDNYVPSSIEVSYLKEANLGETICCEYSLLKNESLINEYNYCICEKESKSDLAIGKIGWKLR